MVKQNVLVVGGSSGLGAAIALKHCSNGDAVWVGARRIERLKQLRNECDSGQWKSVEVDLHKESTVMNMFKICKKPTLVYLSAGIPDSTSIEEVMTVNFIQLVKIAMHYDALNTKIVFISSIASIIPFPELSVYCASKSALEKWVLSASEKSISSMIIVRPGQFKSEFFSSSAEFDVNELPHSLADKIIDCVKNCSSTTTITLGGWRDKLAVKLASVLGGYRTRKLIL